MANPDLPSTITAQATADPVDSSYRINIHFQPDLPYKDTTVIESLAVSKQYHSQFKTGISNGGLINASGRTDWEARLFGDFCGESTTTERPKYGSLNFHGDTYGSSPRFGSCYFRLTQSALPYTTFAFPDSAATPKAFGTAEHFSGLDALARETDMEDPLNWYIEAHVHAPLLIPRDMEAVVLDPSYKGTYVEDAANKLGCKVEWHEGYELLDVKNLRKHEEYRGKEFVDIAEQLADEQGRLDCLVLGRAYRGSSFARQEIKMVWHYLARFGRKTPWPQMVESS